MVSLPEPMILAFKAFERGAAMFAIGMKGKKFNNRVRENYTQKWFCLCSIYNPKRCLFLLNIKIGMVRTSSVECSLISCYVAFIKNLNK